MRSLSICLLTYLFFLTYYHPLHAQETSIFEFIEKSEAELGEHSLALAEALGNPEIAEGVKQSWAIRFQNFSRQEELQLPVKLPGINRTLKLESITYFEQNLKDDNGDHEYEIWSGEIIGPRQRGEFMLSRSPEGLISGHIHFNRVTYKIRPINYGDAVLLEKDPTSLKGGSCAQESVPEVIDFEGNINSANSTTSVPFCDPLPPEHLCRKTWKILNVYTDSLYNQIYDAYYQALGGSPYFPNLPAQLTYNDLTEGLRNFGLLLVQSGLTYQPFSNSTTSVPHAAVATSQVSNNYQWISNDRAAFETYAKQNFSPIYDQDIAVLQTQRTYGGIYGIADGVPVSVNGYNHNLGESALVNYYEGIGYPWYAYAHELGHCFGGEHDDVAPILCNRGYQFRLNYNGPDRTIMATLSDTEAAAGKGSILYFSNPAQTYDGYTIGTTSRYIQRVVQNVLCDNIGESAPPAMVEKPYINSWDNPKAKVFPNPTTGKIYLELEKNTDLIQLLDTPGKYCKLLNHPKTEL